MKAWLPLWRVTMQTLSKSIGTVFKRALDGQYAAHEAAASEKAHTRNDQWPDVACFPNAYILIVIAAIM